MTGFRRWYGTLSGPVLWMVHITGVAALASAACGHDSYTLAAHALTVVTALATLLALSWSWRMAADQGTVKFLGHFGLFVGGLSLLLILLEDVYIWTVRVCG